MKKSKLESTFDIDFDLFGLVGNAKEYKLAWYINKEFDFDLLKQDDIRIEFSDKSSILISYYLHETDNLKVELLQNKLLASAADRNKFLIPELNQFDYLLKIRDESGELKPETITTTIKQIPIVEYVMRLNFDALKSKENLLY